MNNNRPIEIKTAQSVHFRSARSQATIWVPFHIKMKNMRIYLCAPYSNSSAPLSLITGHMAAFAQFKALSADC